MDPPENQMVKIASLVGNSYIQNKVKWVATVDMTIDPALSGAAITGA